MSIKSGVTPKRRRSKKDKECQETLGIISKMINEINKEEEDGALFRTETERLNQLLIQVMTEFWAEMEFTKKLYQKDKNLLAEPGLVQLTFLRSKEVQRLGLLRLQHLQRHRDAGETFWKTWLTSWEWFLQGKRNLVTFPSLTFDLEKRALALESSSTRMEHSQALRESVFTDGIKKFREFLESYIESSQFSSGFSKKSLIFDKLEPKVNHMSSIFDWESRKMDFYFKQRLIDNIEVIEGLRVEVALEKSKELKLRKMLKEALIDLDNIRSQIRTRQPHNKNDNDLEGVRRTLKKVQAKRDHLKRQEELQEVVNETLLAKVKMASEETSLWKSLVTQGLVQREKVLSMSRINHFLRGLDSSRTSKTSCSSVKRLREELERLNARKKH